MTSGLEKLLQPISPENPCGEDLSYDPAAQELETLILGKPETQFSPGEPPNWREVKQRSIDLLERSKHLRIVIMLSAALVRTDGLPGFRDALELLLRLLENFWVPLYPRLDPEDHDDPTERVNIIATIATPVGTLGDPFKFLEGLRACPLTQSPTFGQITMEEISQSRAGVKPPKGKLPSASDIDAAFRDTPPDILTQRTAAATESVAFLKAIQAKMDELVGIAKTRDLGPLAAVLSEIQKQLAAFKPEGAPAGDAPAEAGAADAPATGEAVPRRASVLESVESRQDVTKALELVCKYYTRHEPSSPIPLLLQRALRLVEQDFLGVLADLSPETLEKVKAAAGVPK